MAATNKCLAQNNKSRTGEATKTAVDAGDQPRRTRKSQKHKVNAALEMARNRNSRERTCCPMKPTTKIRFTESQIALVMRAHPNSNLDHLKEVSFEFDQAGRIIACIGTIMNGVSMDHDYAGRGL